MFKLRTGPANLPAAGDTVHVYLTGTTTPVNLFEADGSAPISNPITVPEGEWGFEPEDSSLLDIYWSEESANIMTEVCCRNANLDQISISRVKPYHGIMSIGALGFARTGTPGSYVFTLTIATGAEYFYKGTKKTITGAQDINLATALGGALAAKTLYWVTYDDVSGDVSVGTSSDFKEQVSICTFFTNTAIDDIRLNYEAHNHTRDIDWHLNQHLTEGAKYYSGFAQTKPSASFDDDLDLSTGIIIDEDIHKTTTNPTASVIWYQDAAGEWTFADSSLPYAGSVTGQPQYLDTDTYALTDVGASDFACYWVYGTTDNDNVIYIVPTHATAAHNTIAEARTEAPPVLINATTTLNREWRLLYRWIYKGDGEYQEAEDYRNETSTPGGGIAAQTASSVSYLPSGDLSATNAQAALDELESEKAPLASPTITGTLSYARAVSAYNDFGSLAAASNSISFATYTNRKATADTDPSAATGTVTIVDYSALGSATVTVGSDVLTEGVDWTAATSNDATATSLASAIDALTDVGAAAVGAVVTVTAATAGPAGNSIALATSDGTNITLSGAALSGGADVTVAITGLSDGQRGSLRIAFDTSQRTLVFTGVTKWIGTEPTTGPASGETMTITFESDDSEVIGASGAAS